MGRPDYRPFAWVALALVCLAALACRPTAGDRDFQLLTLSLALAASAGGVALSSSSFALPVPGMLLIGWTALGLAPLPMEWLRRLDPSRAEAVEAAMAAGSVPWTSLAANPPAAIRAAVILAGLISLFAICRAATSVSRRAADVLILGLVALAAVQAAVGLEQYLSALHSGETEALARGLFVNRGQFAAFLLSAFCVGAGWFCHESELWRRRPEWAVAGAAVLLLLAAGLLASMSRAALVVAVLLAVATALWSGRRAKWAGLAALLILGAGLGLTNVGERVGRRFERLAQEQGDLGRLAIWRDSAPLAGRHALAGVGLGGYGAVFERTSAYFPRKSVDHAHSDWLEAGIELGALGLGTVLAAIGTVVFRGLRNKPSAMTFGCLAGAAGPLLQGLVDLPTQSPAVAAAVACCLGLAAGRSHPQSKPQPHNRVSVRSAATVLVAVGALFVAFCPPQTADQAFARAESAWVAGELPIAHERLLETLGIQPRAAAAWLRLSEAARAGGDIEEALRLARQARRWAPFILRTEWALADLELAHGDTMAALGRLSMISDAVPDMRPAAIQALARGGVERKSIETTMGTADGQAAGDYLVFLARNQDSDLQPAYQRLVVERGLKPPPDEAAYIARVLGRSSSQ